MFVSYPRTAPGATENPRKHWDCDHTTLAPLRPQRAPARAQPAMGARHRRRPCRCRYEGRSRRCAAQPSCCSRSSLAASAAARWTASRLRGDGGRGRPAATRRWRWRTSAQGTDARNRGDQVGHRAPGIDVPPPALSATLVKARRCRATQPAPGCHAHLDPHLDLERAPAAVGRQPRSGPPGLVDRDGAPARGGRHADHACHPHAWHARLVVVRRACEAARRKRDDRCRSDASVVESPQEVHGEHTGGYAADASALVPPTTTSAPKADQG